MGPSPRPASDPRGAHRPRASGGASWRGGSRQALLARLLAGCDVEALDDGQARSVGSLAARAATGDIVDACVVEGALRRRDLVVSSDEDDLQAISAAVSRRLEVDGP